MPWVAFRGITAPASLKRLVGGHEGAVAIGAFRGITAPASLKRAVEVGIGQVGRRLSGA